MRKFIASAILVIASTSAVADDWIAPLLGGMILGNAFSAPRAYAYGYNYAPPPTVVYQNSYYYNPAPPPPTQFYALPYYRVQHVWDPYCGCYRSVTVRNY